MGTTQHPSKKELTYFKRSSISLFAILVDMTGKEIVEKVKKLNLPEGEYVVFGSGPLALAGIREGGDIDMLVSDKLLEQLKAAGWKQIMKGENDKPYTFEDFEVHNSWKFSDYCPTLEHLLETATWADGVPFASLEEVKKWKLASGRPKDEKDLELIDAFLAKS